MGTIDRMDEINIKIKKILKSFGLWMYMHLFISGLSNVRNYELNYIIYFLANISENKSFEEVEKDAKNDKDLQRFRFDGFFGSQLCHDGNIKNLKESIEEFGVNYVCDHIHSEYKDEDLVKILEGLKDYTSFNSIVEKINVHNQIVFGYLNKNLFEEAYDYFEKHKILNREFYDQFLNITKNPKFKEINDILEWIRKILENHINLILDEKKSEKDENKSDELYESFLYFRKIRSSFHYYIFDVENLKKLQQSNDVIEDVKSFYESNVNGNKKFDSFIFLHE